MDSITHTLFGLTIYGAIDKEEMEKTTKRAFLFTAVVGSLIPDSDVVSQLWDTEGLYQMWHRGITHSLFMVPIWALLLWLVCRFLFKVKDPRIFYIGLLSVFIHCTSDLFNAWGTGYLEPFSDLRVTFGTIPIVDLTFWAIMLLSFLFVRLKKKLPFTKHKQIRSHFVYRAAWLLMILHIIVQSTQGYTIYQQTASSYEEHTLSATFVPWNFTVIGKKGETVELSHANLWNGLTLQETLPSAEGTDLEELFAERPEAKTLYQWSPFVVIVDDDQLLGIYDPRFYRNGQSFLFEYIEKGF
ncbi:metal-dependent hydrolase [Bacillus horti]|uniref:Inner membrane protein n=1 Tax=Caldalkalibacillus horti TaxID=77523 RepID=A0ABT9W087_9BACI|nr:metal-dependent hydrolase [Bacillus horti]MDQ0166671.1 inner membrane protein [Bacillus horti]